MDNSYWLECVGPGWRSIVLPILEKLTLDGILITQVKEKFGTLRIYTGPAMEYHYEMIDAAARLSAKTCESCGKTGEVKERNGWLKCLCGECDA